MVAAAPVRVPRAKAHHFVPQFHLRHFGAGVDAQQVWVYDKTTDRIALRPIKAIAVRKDYYTVETDHGPTDELERIFAQVEGQAAPVIARLCAAPFAPNGAPRYGLDLDLPDRYALGLYLALLYSRVPANRLGSEQLWEELHAATLYYNLNHRDGWLTWAQGKYPHRAVDDLEAERQRLLDDLIAGNIKIRADEAVSLDFTIQGMAQLPPYIVSKGWWLVKRRSFPGFPIGDNPVALWRGREHPVGRGASFGKWCRAMGDSHRAR